MIRTRMTVRIFLSALFLGAGLAGTARASEALLGASEDNFVLPDTVAFSRHNWGVYPELVAGLNATNQPYRSLLRFDLSSLGASTSITSATLTLTVTRTNKLSQLRGNFALNLFLLANANKAWVQGTNSEVTATAGESCWRYRQYDTANWTGGPGIGNTTNSAGIAALLACVAVDVTNTVVGDKFTFTVDTADGVAALAAWAAGGDNAGLFLTTDEVYGGQNAIYFGSKENATAGNRPQFVVHTMTGDVSFGAADDTFILNGGVDYGGLNNWGVYTELWAGLLAADQPYRTLLRFDLSPLRARYTTLDSATLTLTVVNTNRISVERGNFELRLFQLADANAGWVEGAKNAALSDMGESCWEYRRYDTNIWAGGRGIGNSTASAGISNLLAAVTIDVATITNGQKIVFTLSSPTARAVLEAWACGRTNAGLFLASDETSNGRNSIGFGSSEHATPASRPQLAVTYTTDETAFIASEDNFMYNSASYTNTNWGTTTPIVIGLNSATTTYRTLMRFDLSTLNRQQKQVKWATLTLTETAIAKIVKANGNFETRLFLLADSNAGWVEGSKNAATAGTGESCWRWRQYNTVGWTGGEGIGISTNSGIRTLLATATIDVNTFVIGSTVTFFIESPEGLAALETWARGGTNAGFLLTTDEASGGMNALQVASSEYATVASRPTLRVVLEPKILRGTLIRIF